VATTAAAEAGAMAEAATLAISFYIILVLSPNFFEIHPNLL
jgi:hypothetical protein